MNARLETITPELARLYLSLNKKNRTIRENVVSKYAKDMYCGWWDSNGETIKFDEEGMLADGQHRLKAVIQAGVSVEMLVVRGIPVKAKATIDSGSKRLVGDMLGMYKNLANGRTLAAAINMLYKLKRRHSLVQPSTISSRETEKLIEEHPGIVEICNKVCTSHKVRNIISPALFVALLYLFTKRNHCMANKLFEEFRDGKLSSSTDNTSENFLLLREWLIMYRITGKKTNNNVLAATIIRTWNKTLRSEKIVRVASVNMIDKFYEVII